MNSWPKVYLPPLEGIEYPSLKLVDSNKGLVELDNGSNFAIYVCGITPYDATHLGHAATYLAFDLINRYKILSGSTVNFVENITDIDDPLLERAKRDNQGWQDLASKQIDLFSSDMSALRVMPPDSFIKVTDSLALIEDFISRLDKAGYLYKLDSDYYFSVGKFLDQIRIPIEQAIDIFAERGGDPMRAGKQHQLDPVIWIGNRDGEPGWASSYGFGRPGWHVECTAIACNYLDKSGSNPIIDLQGGGSDLIFPHHFMSAQIVKAAYGRDFAKYFVHAAMIGLAGEKMSKSKGNLVFVSKLLTQQVDPMVIRWALLSGHYQQDRQWSDNLLAVANDQVTQIRSALARSEVAQPEQLIKDLVSDISNNLDTPAALARLIKWAKQSESNPTVNQSGLVSRTIDALLGLAL
ncbi:MAG: class I tRNA ligase family protein [Actinobacteria bacterium]|nr:class I tRNA ligase family protein [Actinomycetota bacterium]